MNGPLIAPLRFLFSKSRGLPEANLDAPEISELLFYPRPNKETNGLEPTETHVNGAVLGGLWREHPDSDDVLLFFHGNGEIALDWSGLIGQYAMALDASVWIVDYRGYGRSTGTPTYGAMLSDAEAIFAALAEREGVRGRPFRHRFVFGRSIGSAPAIHLAWRFPDRVNALVVDSGFAHVTELVRRFRESRNLLGGAPVTAKGFPDNVDKLRSCPMPTLLLHGVADRVIPVEEARENFAASAARGKRLVEIPGAGHNDLLYRARTGDLYFGALRALRNNGKP